MNPEDIELLPEMQNQLGIKSLRDLESRLLINRVTLRRLATEVEKHYEPFPQEKRKKPFQRPKAGEKKKIREIDNPSKELKAVQRRIDTVLIKPLLFPQYLHGSVPGKTIKTNADVHLGAKTLVKMDITSYFPSLSNNHVYRIWANVLGCSPRVASLLTKLTTYKRRLPQGAPTSSGLANVYLSTVMPPVISVSRNKGTKLSAYVDDVAFSGDNSRQMMEPMRMALACHGLKLASKKRKILGSTKEKVLCGIRLGRDGKRAPHEKMRDIRAGIHKLTLGIPLPKGRKQYLESLKAKIRHVEGICAMDGLRLRKQLTLALSPPK